MTDCCIHTSDIARRQHLRSAGCHQLFVPRHRRSMSGRRACSVAGPAACNSLYQTTCEIRHVPLSRKLFCSRLTRAHAALQALRLCDYALYKSGIDIDIDIDARRPYPGCSSWRCYLYTRREDKVNTHNVVEQLIKYV